MYNFEKLQVWQEAMDLVEIIYQLTNKLPSREKFSLIDQIRRSSASVALNIAEGSGDKTKKDFINFCRNALKSLYETITAPKIIERIYKTGVIKELNKCDQVSKILHGLIKYLDHGNQKPTTKN